MEHDVVSIDEAVTWLEQHPPDAVDDLRLLGKTRFGGDTPAEFVMAAYEREKAEAERRGAGGMSEPKMVYVTKYALSDGIRRCAVRKEDPKYAWVAWPGAPSYGLLVHRVDVHDTLDAAQARAKEMARKKLKSLAKQASRLEQVAALGVVVHGEPEAP